MQRRVLKCAARVVKRVRCSSHVHDACYASSSISIPCADFMYCGSAGAFRTCAGSSRLHDMGAMYASIDRTV